MNYSPVGIANMSLLRIGARGTIGSFQEDSPNANKIAIVWDMVFQEVLSARDWKFAKTRAQLQQNADAPAGGYRYAYSLPSDFLRLCKPREIPQERPFSSVSMVGWGLREPVDLPVFPREAAPYVVEAVLSSGTNYTNNLLTNYPWDQTYADSCPIIINYIRLITDFTQLLPGFVNCLSNRLSAELAIAITEDKQKYEGMMQMYHETMNSAQAQIECDDFLQDEAGSQSWVTAGRCWGGYR